MASQCIRTVLIHTLPSSTARLGFSSGTEGTGRFSTLPSPVQVANFEMAMGELGLKSSRALAKQGIRSSAQGQTTLEELRVPTMPSRFLMSD